MGLIADILSAWKYRKKEYVSTDEFITALERDFHRKLDPESVLFFRNHSMSVNLLNRILSGKLKQTGDSERDGLVVKALIAEMVEYLPPAGDIDMESDTIMSDIVEEFSRTYKDAGNVIGQAFVLFYGLKERRQNIGRS